jgi:serine/threonine protein kinase
MNADQNRAKSIFLNAAEIASRADQVAYLEAQCGDDEALRREVAELLAHHAPARAFLEAPAAQLGTTIGELASEQPGTVIGPYKLLQQIGEGGMGTVFMAEQTQPVQRKVALKVIKAGMDSRQVIARFEAER